MRRFPYMRIARKRSRVPNAVFPLLLTAALSVGFFLYLSGQMKPVIATMAVSKATNLISLAISEETDASLMSENLSYTDFVSVETNQSGQVALLSFQAAECNRFKRLVIRGLVERLEAVEAEMLSVPLGNLTGIVLFSSLGPSVRVQIQSVGDIKAEFENTFTSAGVNQTRHAVYLKMEVTVYLLLPGEIIPVSVQERVCVAETVIVGAVPETYLNVMDGAN